MGNDPHHHPVIEHAAFGDDLTVFIDELGRAVDRVIDQYVEDLPSTELDCGIPGSGKARRVGAQFKRVETGGCVADDLRRQSHATGFGKRSDECALPVGRNRVATGLALAGDRGELQLGRKLCVGDGGWGWGDVATPFVSSVVERWEVSARLPGVSTLLDTNGFGDK